MNEAIEESKTYYFTDKKLEKWELIITYCRFKDGFFVELFSASGELINYELDSQFDPDNPDTLEIPFIGFHENLDEYGNRGITKNILFLLLKHSEKIRRLNLYNPYESVKPFWLRLGFEYIEDDFNSYMTISKENYFKLNL